MVQYPEHEKLQKIKDTSQTIGEFIAWLKDSKKIVLAKWYKIEPEDEDEQQQLLPEYINYNDVLAEYFGIDQKKT
jgi:hypothetical protein